MKRKIKFWTPFFRKMEITELDNTSMKEMKRKIKFWTPFFRKMEITELDNTSMKEMKRKIKFWTPFFRKMEITELDNTSMEERSNFGHHFKALFLLLKKMDLDSTSKDEKRVLVQQTQRKIQDLDTLFQKTELYITIQDLNTIKEPFSSSSEIGAKTVQLWRKWGGFFQCNYNKRRREGAV
uniref:Putative ovule protein n=1 Tax=Solanum chacoense TaxID=4108 RepID=A0A0V0GVQ1_SOLCH